MSEIATRLPLFYAGSAPPPPSERGPLARIAPEQRICHVCRCRLTVKGKRRDGLMPRSGLRIQCGGGKITCGRCLSRVKTRETAATLADLREQRFRLQMELLNQRRLALKGAASRRVS